MRYTPGKPTKMAFRTEQVQDFLGISYVTLLRYRRLLGIKPRKAIGVRGRFYSWEEVCAMFELHMPPVDCFVRDLPKRLEMLTEAGRLKNKEPLKIK